MQTREVSMISKRVGPVLAISAVALLAPVLTQARPEAPIYLMWYMAPPGHDISKNDLLFLRTGSANRRSKLRPPNLRGVGEATQQTDCDAYTAGSRDSTTGSR